VQPLPFPVFQGFSAVSSLSLSSDGPIPAEHWHLAHAHDAANRNAPRPLRLGKVTIKPAAILAIMVRIILKEAARKGTVMREDFLRYGLNPIDVDRHFAQALRHAGLLHPGLSSLDAVQAA
jgi:hypothetical protein